MRIKCLIDADMLVYEVGFSTQDTDPETGIVTGRSFDKCVSLLERKVKEITEESWSTEKPTLYLTSSKALITRLNKRRGKEGKKLLVYEPNFREAVAVTKLYKGGRKAAKPLHFENIIAYMLGNYDTKLAMGLEAEDLISIDHNIEHEDYETIICTRDKDLRITSGWHYGWSVGNRPSFGPVVVEELGTLDLLGNGKIRGTGLMFFYSQMLTGDGVDNIPGLKGAGPVAAYNALNECENEEELFSKVVQLYEAKFEESDIEWRVYFKEQAALLWMIQGLDKDGKPIHYIMYDEREHVDE